MTPLGFLDPYAVETDGRFRPLRKSSMQRRLAERGAEFEERDGWLVAVRVPGEDDREPAVRDVTHAFVVHEGEDGWLELGDGVHGHRLPSGHTFIATYRFGGGGVAKPPDGFIDMSAVYAALEIDGAGAETLMRRLTPLDLDDLPAVGPAAHVRAWIFRTGPETFRIFFPQECGHYLWEVAVDAAEPLGGSPAGAPKR